MMRLQVAGVLLLLGGASAAGAAPHWSYANQGDWADATKGGSTNCINGLQSPIDILTTQTVFTSLMKPLNLYVLDDCPTGEFIVDSHTWEVKFNLTDTCKDRIWITWGGLKYYLKQFHFHSPSENTVNSMSYDMEVHLVHQSPLPVGKYLVLAVFLQVGAQKNDFIDRISRFFPDQEGMNKFRGSVGLNPYRTLLPLWKDYYAYNGSFTTPMCNTDVQWVVLKTPVMISKAQRDAYRATISAVKGNVLARTSSRAPAGVALPWSISSGTNNRRSQNLWNRTVYEYPKPQYNPQLPLVTKSLAFDPKAALTRVGSLKSAPLSLVGCAVAACAVAMMFGYLLGSSRRRSDATADSRRAFFREEEDGDVAVLYPGAQD